MTYAEFIDTYKLGLSAERTDSNPNMTESRDMDHWKCVLKCGRRKMTLVFSMGYGHNGAEPKLADVLDCLASDSATIDNADDFEQWCSELGYDPDSRKAERTYKVCAKQSEKFMRLLGDAAYQQLLYETERL